MRTDSGTVSCQNARRWSLLVTVLNMSAVMPSLSSGCTYTYACGKCAIDDNDAFYKSQTVSYPGHEVVNHQKETSKMLDGLSYDLQSSSGGSYRGCFAWRMVSRAPQKPAALYKCTMTRAWVQEQRQVEWVLEPIRDPLAR
jgi:hypothetical protein